MVTNFSHLHPRIIECGLGTPARVALKHEPELQPLLDEMRNRVPVDGSQYERALVVVTGPGFKSNYVATHKHTQHVMLYYVEPTSAIVIEGDVHLPSVGEFLYLKPETLHLVKKSDSRRVVVAMLVAE